MTGVILCGGQSTRMQRDKGLLLSGRFTWAERLALLLQPICGKVLVSVNAEQDAYQSKLAGFNLVTDDGSLHIYGPLLGLLTVHRHCPEDDLFLLACDMQQMETAVLKTLLDEYHANPGFGAWVFQGTDGQPEPLAAIYSAKSLAGVLGAHLHSPLPKHSMKYMLGNLKVFSIPIRPEWAKCFANFNSPQQAGLIGPP